MTDAERRQLRRFLLHLHWVLNHPAAHGQAVMAWAHGMPYSGPTLDRHDIHAMAGLPAELPEPTYPEDEYCVERRSVPGTALRWSEPVKENVVFPSGTLDECRAWTAANGDPDTRTYGVNRTGGKLNTDQEAEEKWCAQFEERL